jgi:hypothetical protein
VRYVGEQEAPRTVGGLQLRRALLQIERHLIERAREGRHLVPAVLARAGRQIAGADFSSGVLETSQPRPNRTENQQRSSSSADRDKHGPDQRECRPELAQRGARHRHHHADGSTIDNHGGGRTSTAHDLLSRSRGHRTFRSHGPRSDWAASPGTPSHE